MTVIMIVIAVALFVQVFYSQVSETKTSQSMNNYVCVRVYFSWEEIGTILLIKDDGLLSVRSRQFH